MNELALFAGGGGGIYGSLLLGHTPVCAVEIMPRNRDMLLQRQRDGVFPPFPIWDDVCTFDGRPWAGLVDIVSGGFPCQDISVAGKGAGLDGERSGLWREFARIIGEVRPRYAFIENSPALVTRGLDRVLCDLAALGFDAEWGVIGAHHVGAPHRRDRIWILAHCERNRREGAFGSWAHREAWPQAFERCDSVANANGHADETTLAASMGQKECCTAGDESLHAAAWNAGRTSLDERRRAVLGLESVASESSEPALANTDGERQQQPQGAFSQERGRSSHGSEAIPHTNGAECPRLRFGTGQEHAVTGSGGEYVGGAQGWPLEPRVCRVVDGVADWKHRIFALGNGQVPRVAATAWRLLKGRL